jgi:hypothetical protein
MRISQRPSNQDSPTTRKVKREISLLVVEVEKNTERLRSLVRTQALDDMQLDEPNAQGVSIRQAYSAMSTFLADTTGTTIPDLTEG